MEQFLLSSTLVAISITAVSLTLSDFFSNADFSLVIKLSFLYAIFGGGAYILYY